MGDYSATEGSGSNLQQPGDTRNPNAVAVQDDDQEPASPSAETDPIASERKDAVPGGQHPPDPSPASATRSEHGADDASSAGRAPSAFSTGLNIDDSSDGDSSVGDIDRPSSSVSATSSVFDFVEEHGRTFHSYKAGKYFLPNDISEND
ncbi:hypothetical protein GE09DRAFT_1220269 [Coniochaeta sp. 2T2.1]|nr:hypothetical protein GE09DRAFT_1220269 [Coniochaeta sp. 2T2.1]